MKKVDLLIAFIAILVVAGLTLGLGELIPDRPLTPSHPFSLEKGGTKAKAKAGKVVMHVNGEPITEGEFNAFAQSAPAQQRAFLSGSAEGRRLLANEIVKLKALEQEAARLGVENDPDVRGQIEMTNAQIVASRALEKLVSDKVNQYVNAEFQKEKASTIVLRHIVIAYAGGQLPPRDGSAPGAEEAFRKATALTARLRGGADFAATARAESDDQQSAMNGGSLGATRREMLPAEIASIVGNLKPGQISDPVRTPYGMHIFRLDEPSLEEMRPALMRGAQQRAVAETLTQLQEKAKVDLDPTFFPPAAPARPKS